MEGKDENIKQKVALQLHYFDYHIGEDLINTDSPVGVKLTDPSVKVLDQFQQFALQQTDLELSPENEVTNEGADLENNTDDNRVQSPSSSIESLSITDELIVLLKGLVKATGCTPSQLLLNQIFEVTSASGESKFFLVSGKNKQQLPTVEEPQLILQGISQLRLNAQIQELIKLSPEKIDSLYDYLA